MGRGNYGDAADWVRRRKSFHDSVDDAINQCHERRRMELIRVQGILETALVGGDVRQSDPYVLTVEIVSPDMLRVFITRGGNTKGCDEIILKIEGVE